MKKKKSLMGDGGWHRLAFLLEKYALLCLAMVAWYSDWYSEQYVYGMALWCFSYSSTRAGSGAMLLLSSTSFWPRAIEYCHFHSGKRL